MYLWTSTWHISHSRFFSKLLGYYMSFFLLLFLFVINVPRRVLGWVQKLCQLYTLPWATESDIRSRTYVRKSTLKSTWRLHQLPFASVFRQVSLQNHWHENVFPYRLILISASQTHQLTIFLLKIVLFVTLMLLCISVRCIIELPSQ